MGTTSNYSWPYPASTDPVADGAQNIEDLATDADTTVRGIELATVMRFADAAARTAALSGIEVEGMVTFLQDTDALEYYDGSAWQGVGGATMLKKVDRFTSSGTWTVPAGVTYAIAHITGGGGGIGANTSNAGQGGSSSVAFASGTVTATGGGANAVAGDGSNITGSVSVAGQANSGHGAGAVSGKTGSSSSGRAEDGAYIVAGAAVTPAASITVTVGAGGTAGTGGDGGAAGGSGYVWIEYYEEA